MEDIEYYVAVDLDILVDQGVPETDHPDPFVPEVRGDQPTIA
jgi:hypothetical protein